MDENKARYEITRASIEIEDGKLPDAEARLNTLIAKIAASETVSMKMQLCSALLKRASVRQYSNRFVEALEDLTEAETLALQLPFLQKKNFLLNVYSSQAKILSSKNSGTLRNNKAALDCIERAKQLGCFDWGIDQLESEIAYQSGDWEKAASLAKKAYDAAAKEGWFQGVASLRHRRGDALSKLGQLQEAEHELNEALQFFKQRNIPDRLALTQLSLAELHSSQGKKELAWAYSSEALENIESLIGQLRELLTQQQFLHDKLNYYEQAFSIALAEGGATGVERAWSVVERAKSFHLCQLVASSDVSFFEGVPADEIRHLKELEEELDNCHARQSRLGEKNLPLRNELQCKLERIYKDRQTLLSDLMRNNPRWASIRSPHPFNLQETLSELDEGWGLISYHWIERPENRATLYIFYTDENNQPAYLTTDWSEEDLIKLDAVKKKKEPWEPVIPSELNEKIFPEEIRRALANKSRLLISPHGRLRGIPLHIVDIDDDLILIEQWQVQYIPSLSLLSLQRREKQQDKILLVCCRQAFGKDPLEEVENEINDLAAQWNAKRPGKTRSFPLHSNSSLMQMGFNPHDWPTFDVIHFACHGEFPQDRPFDAALLLGKDALRATEIFTIKLNASLVVLSACCLGQTSENYSGLKLVNDEWVGLFLPLFYAGARALIVSCWDANSEGAESFMKDLHTALSKGLLPISAFQEAVKSAKDQEPQFKWANWYLVGFPSIKEDKA